MSTVALDLSSALCRHAVPKGTHMRAATELRRLAEMEYALISLRDAIGVELEIAIEAEELEVSTLRSVLARINVCLNGK